MSPLDPLTVQKIISLPNQFGERFGESSEKMSGKILTLIKADRKITIAELSEKIGITERSIERNLRKLQKENLLKRVGSYKGGHWEVIEE